MKKNILRRELTESKLDLSTCGFDPSYQNVLERIFNSRGVITTKELNYKLANLLPPNSMKGLAEALQLLISVREQKQKIMIVGDFDADGATSTALAMRCLYDLGYSSTEFLVPNRFEYGYGLTPEIVDLAAERKPDVIITVDNGISSVEGVARANELGIKVIVTDHHLPGEVLPEASAILNPNQLGCEFPCKNMAGVGVVFYLLMALRSRLREQGVFAAGREPNFAKHLDLLALGTVADVVPLDHNNRLLVSQGLMRMRQGAMCPGIKAILNVAGRSDYSKLSASDMGFIVGPRLNAAGRLDDMSLGIRCLLSDSEVEANQLAAELDALNRERRAIESSMQRDAKQSLDKLFAQMDGDLPHAICVYQSDWHQGVIGILASRIKDKYHRPTIVFAEDNEYENDQGEKIETLKGSGRSIPGLHLRDTLDQLAKRAPQMLNKFGGHAMAAGLSIDKRDLNDFNALFNQIVEETLEKDSLEPVIYSDGELQPEQLQLSLAEAINQAGPWGQAFPEPGFDGEFFIVNQKLVGEKHLKLVLAPVQNASYLVDAIAFNCNLEQWPNPLCEKVKVAYKLSVNSFRGKESLQLMVDYLEAV